MTNLFKCLTCGSKIIGENANTHQCKPYISKYKTIEASSYFIVKNDFGEECIAIDAFNGTGYNFEIKEPNLIPLSEGLPCDLTEPKKARSDENLHRELSDGDSPEPFQTPNFWQIASECHPSNSSLNKT